MSSNCICPLSFTVSKQSSCKSQPFSNFSFLKNIFHRTLRTMSGISLFLILTTAYSKPYYFLITAPPSFKKSNSVYKYFLFLIMKAMLWSPIMSYVRTKFWTWFIDLYQYVLTYLLSFSFSSQGIFFPDLRQVCFSYFRWTFIPKLNVILFLIQQTVIYLSLLKSTRNPSAS